MSEDKLVSFEIHETIGVGRGPVGLEPMFQAIDDKLVSEEDLQVCIGAYRQNRIGDSQLLQVFSKLVRLVFASSSHHFDHPNPEGVVAEAADLCLEKMDKYANGAKKCRALNYFMTIIACYLRQSKRSQMNLRKLDANQI